MLTSFSWEDFLIIIALVVIVYYAIIVSLLFRRELLHKFQSRQRKESSADADLATGSKSVSPIMGSIHEDNKVYATRSSTVASDQISVHATASESIQVSSESADDGLLIGNVADLLQSIKTLISQLGERSSEREEIQSLIQVLLQRYPYLQGTSFQHAITVYICEEIRNHLDVQFTAAEVLPWWNK
jgi:predicted RNA-binding protein YlqC (UPF0109 family)